MFVFKFKYKELYKIVDTKYVIELWSATPAYVFVSNSFSVLLYICNFSSMATNRLHSFLLKWTLLFHWCMISDIFSISSLKIKNFSHIKNKDYLITLTACSVITDLFSIKFE